MATLSRHMCFAQKAALQSTSYATRRHISPVCRIRLGQPQRSSSICHSTQSPLEQHTQKQAPLAAPAPALQQTLQSSAFLSVAALLATAGAAHASGAVELYNLADLDAATAHKLETFLRPLFTVFTFLYIIRIPMTWYPSIDGTKLPWVLAYAPTEPILKATRNVIPLVGGVDVTPIVWVALISFFNEILLGPQGILMLIQRQTGGL